MLTTIIQTVVLFATIGFLLLYFTGLSAQAAPPQTSPQPTTQFPVEISIEGTLHIYLVTLYGDSLQEIDHYRKTHKEGECITFVLKTDKPVDMTQYLLQEEIEFLSDVDTIMQSEFMPVPDWEVFESFSGKDFAAQYAHKHVRVTGTLLFPDGRLAERHTSEDGLPQGGGDGVRRTSKKC